MTNRLPTWLEDEQTRINIVLSSTLHDRLPDPDLASYIQRCLLNGRKIRSVAFTIARRATATENLDRNIVYAIECAHAASVLVDDILDGDAFRHGYAATQTVWGPGRSSLISHLLISSSLDALASLPVLQKRLLTAYGDSCRGELHDVMLVPGDWIYEGYDERVYSKTAALFIFALESAHYMNSGRADGALSELGRSLGCLYQLANDFFDWQPSLLLERHTPDQSWPVTFSFPLAIYMKMHGHNRLGDVRNRDMSYSDWIAFLSIIWQPDVEQACRDILASAHARVVDLLNCRELDADQARKLRSIADLAITRDFWFHEMKAA
jgi:geranylgeranyl pyrophosphate synthase